MARGKQTKTTKETNNVKNFSQISGVMRLYYNEEYDQYSTNIFKQAYDKKKKKAIEGEYITHWMNVYMTEDVKKIIDDLPTAKGKKYIEIDIVNGWFDVWENKHGDTGLSIFINEINDLPF